MKRHSILFSLTALVLALVLSACGGSTGGTGGTGGTGASAGDPGAAAKAFFDAVFSGGSVDNLLCTSNAATAKSIKSAMDTMKSTLSASGAKIDTSGLKYEVSNQTADSADVKVSGKLKMTVSGTSTEQDFPSAPLKMKSEGGAWKVCG